MGLYSESALDVIVDPAIAGNSGAGTLADPYGDLEYAIATLTDPGTGGIAFWIKAGTAEFITDSLDVALAAATINPAITHQMEFRGFGTTPWDMTRAEIDCDGTGSVITNGETYCSFFDLYIHNSGAESVIKGAGGTNVVRCEISGSTGSGTDGYAIYNLGSYAYILGNYLHDSTGGGVLYIGEGEIAYNYFISGAGQSAVIVQAGSMAFRNIVKATHNVANQYAFGPNTASLVLHNSAIGNDFSNTYGIQSAYSRLNNLIQYNAIEGYPNGIGTLGNSDLFSVYENSIYSSASTAYKPAIIAADENAPDYWYPVSDRDDPAADGFNDILGASPFANAATPDYHPVDTGGMKESNTISFETLIGLAATNVHKPWRGAVEPKGDGTSSGNVIYAWPGALEPAFDATCVMTGTLAVGADENDVVSGGATTILTLSDATWAAAGTGPIGSTANTQAIIDGITARTTPTTGWNNIVRDTEATASVVRTSATVCTITWTAAPTYDVGSTEILDVIIPAAAISTANAVNVGWF